MAGKFETDDEVHVIQSRQIFHPLPRSVSPHTLPSALFDRESIRKMACDPSRSTMQCMCPESCRADHLQARKARPAVPAVVWQTADRQPGWSPRPRPKKERILPVVKQSAKVDESPAVFVCYCQRDVQVVEWLSVSNCWSGRGCRKTPDRCAHVNW